MKVLHVITSLRTGGAEKLMVDLLPRLKQRGFDVSICLFDGIDTPFKQKLIESQIPIFELGKCCSVYNPRLILKLINLLKKHRFEIIHTHNTSPQLFTALASIGLNVRLCTTEHNTTNRRRGSVLWKFIDKWMYSRYSSIICISKKTEKNLRDEIGDADSTKIVTINNGIDISQFRNAINVYD